MLLMSCRSSYFDANILSSSGQCRNIPIISRAGIEPWLDSRLHANLPEKVRQADIVVAAVGQAEMIKGDWIKPGATVIDVGTTRVERDGKKRLVGDVEFEAAARTAAAITLVPGGVGPMTIMTLMHNTVVAAHRRSRLAVPQLW